MRLPKTDIPFARDDANRFLPWIVAVMVAIAALLLAVGISFAGALGGQHAQMAGSLQIQVQTTAKNRAANEASLKNVMRATRGVKEATVLSEAEVAKLLKPWLGEEAKSDAVNLPLLADIRLDSALADTFDTKALAAALKAKGLDARIATPEHWLRDLSNAMGLAQMALLVLAGCVVASLVALAVLVARTSLRLHFKVVNLLHMFGATDDYILKQFQTHNGLLIGRGAAIGAVVAAALLLLMHIATSQMQNPVLPVIHFSVAHAVLFVALPAFIALVSLVATRLTVQGMLHKMH